MELSDPDASATTSSRALPAESSSSGGRLGRSLSWTALGELIFAAAFLGVLVVLGNLGSARVLGAFTLSRAVVLPAILLTNLHLRPVYVVEPPGRWELGTFLALRTLSWPVWLVVITAVSWFAGYDAEILSMLGAMALFCFAESLGDICIAATQRAQRMRRFGISRAARGVLMLAGVVAGLMVADDGVLGCWVGAVATLIFTFTYDISTLKPFGGFCPDFSRADVGALFRRTLPAGLAAGSLTLAQGVPAYALEHLHDLEVVGRFGALGAIIAVGGVINVVVGNAAIPQLARHAWTDRRAFVLLLFRLCLLVSAAHGAVITALWLGGPLYLQAFGADFMGMETELLLAGCVGLVAGLTNILSQAVTATGAFRAQLFASASAIVPACLLASWWTRDAPLRGALAVLAAVAVYRAACFVVLLSRPSRPSASHRQGDDI